MTFPKKTERFWAWQLHIEKCVTRKRLTYDKFDHFDNADPEPPEREEFLAIIATPDPLVVVLPGRKLETFRKKMHY